MHLSSSNSFLTLSESSSISRGHQPRCRSRALSPDSSTAARLVVPIMCVVGPGIPAARSASPSSHPHPPPPPPPRPSATPSHLPGAHCLGASICRVSPWDVAPATSVLGQIRCPIGHDAAAWWGEGGRAQLAPRRRKRCRGEGEEEGDGRLRCVRWRNFSYFLRT